MQPNLSPVPGAVPMAPQAMTPSSNPAQFNPFTPVPGPTPDQSIVPVPKVNWSAPTLPTAPSIDYSQFGSDTSKAATAVQNATSQLMNSQGQARSNAFNQYNQAVQSFGNPSDVYNKMNQAANIPLYQQQMSGIRNLLSHLSDDVTQRVQGTDMNAAQRDKLYQVEYTPLNQQLGDVGQAETAAEGNVAKQMDFYNQSMQQELDPIKTYLSSLDLQFGNQLNAFKGVSDAGLNSVQNLFNKSLTASQGNGGNYIPSLNLPGSPASSQGGVSQGAPTGKAAFKNGKDGGGGFAFTDSQGKPISAAQYSQLSGIPFRTLLQGMADKGDQGAKSALGFVGNTYGYDPTKVGNNQNLINLYNSLVGGTGRKATAYTPQQNVFAPAINNAASLYKTVTGAFHPQPLNLSPNALAKLRASK